MNGAIAQKYKVPFYLALNASSSIGIVFVNKLVFRNYGFPFGTFLTVIHFFITFFGLLICLALGIFEFKRLPVVKLLPLCLSFCGFVALTNLSLVYNTIGFYQLIKVLTTPLLVVIQSLFYGQKFSTPVKFALTLTCVGVTIATSSDSEVNFLGTVIALSALLVTCMYQIWVGTKQKEFDCDSFQLLFYQAPISAAMLLPVAYLVDDLGNSLYMPCPDTLVAIAGSGVLAFLVNISIFLVIGKTSPVTYNVLGHFKLCIILSLGFIAFHDPLTLKLLFGIILTLCGVFWYTHLKTAEMKHKDEGGAEAKAVLVEVDDENTTTKSV